MSESTAAHRFSPWLVLLMGLIAGCQPKNQFVPPPPAKVTVGYPVQENVADSIELTGTTKATATVEIRARVNGYLKHIAFGDGALVTEGEPLFEIERDPYEAELAAADANLQKAAAMLQLAEANLARTAQLVREKTISLQQLDIDKAERATAAANVNAAQAAVTQAKLNLAYTEIRAPITGRIGRHLVDRGNLVHSEETILAVIESIDPIHVYFYVSERDLLRFMEMLRQKKLPDPEKTPPVLHLGLANETNFPHEGHLDFRELGVDPGTGTVLRRAVFPNPDRVLIPGLFVRLSASIGDPAPRVFVEQRALAADQRGDYVLVVNPKNVVEYRPVKLGIAVGDKQVIDEGLALTDRIVINGLQRARPGETVDPQLEVATAATGSAEISQVSARQLTTTTGPAGGRTTIGTE